MSGNLNLNFQSDERAITNLTESIATACRHCVSKSRCCSTVVVCMSFFPFPRYTHFISFVFFSCRPSNSTMVIDRI